jgi:hypothetical protein
MRSRLLAAILALPAAFAMSGLAVAHGLDHAAISEHASHHSDEAGKPSMMRGEVEVAVSDTSSHEEDHQHPTLGAGVRGNHDSSILAVPTRAIAFPLATFGSDPRIPFARYRINAHRSHAPPPHLRGPPGVAD